MQNTGRGPRWRLLAVLPAAVALLAGLAGALTLLGLPSLPHERLPDLHGGLLVLGFVGTLIAVERAVALRIPAGWAAPALLGAGAVALLLPVPSAVGRGLLVAGIAALLAVHVALWRRRASHALAVQVLGVALGAGSALLWWGGTPVAVVLPWFAAFLVLTIAGERVELAGIGSLRPAGETGGRAVAPAAVAPAAVAPTAVAPTVVAPAARALHLAVAVTAGTVAATLWAGPGHVLLGVAVVALVAHLVVHDVARRTARSAGLPRFVAWCLLAGYAWLLVAGGTWMLAGAVSSGPAYDALVHAVFLGFVLSMIMGHAPVILPAVLRIRLPYRPEMWGPLVLLHASLLLRVVGGDLHGLPWALQVGGALNVAAVVLFAAVAAGSAVRAAAGRAPAAASDPGAAPASASDPAAAPASASDPAAAPDPAQSPVVAPAGARP